MDVLADWVVANGGKAPLKGHPTLAAAMQQVSSDKGTFAKYRKDIGREVEGSEIHSLTPGTLPGYDEHGLSSAAEMLILREYGGEFLSSLDRGSKAVRFNATFLRLHLGVCVAGWSCPKALTKLVRVTGIRWGGQPGRGGHQRKGNLIPQAERDLILYHGLGQQGAGMDCPTCGRIVKIIRVAGLTQRGLASIIDALLSDFYVHTIEGSPSPYRK